MVRGRQRPLRPSDSRLRVVISGDQKTKTVIKIAVYGDLYFPTINKTLGNGKTCASLSTLCALTCVCACVCDVIFRKTQNYNKARNRRCTKSRTPIVHRNVHDSSIKVTHYVPWQLSIRLPFHDGRSRANNWNVRVEAISRNAK